MSSIQLPWRSHVWLAVAAGWMLVAVEPLFSQGPPGGSSRGGFSPDEMIGRMDTNQNGQIEPDEFQNSRARYFLEGRLRDAGIDPSKPMPVGKLKEVMQRGPSSGGSSSSGSSSSGSSSSSRDSERERERERSTPKPAANPFAFGIPDPYPLVPGFGQISPGVSMEVLAKKYDRDVMRRVEEALERYDRDKNGILEEEEWRNSRLSDASESDKNKDGRLTREELAERYVARAKADAAERASKSSSSSGGSPSPSPSSSGGGGPPGFGGGPGGGFTGGGFPGGGGPGGGFPGGSFGSRDGGGFGSRDGGSWGSRDGGSRDGGSRDGSSSGSSDRMAGFADGMMRQYDTNKDGKLQKDEWSKMPNDPKSSDKNGDDILTKEELIERLSAFSRSRTERSGGSGSSSSKTGGYTNSQKSYRFLTPAERLPKELPSWFISSDANGDGQVAMAEYATSWTDEKAAKFLTYDANRDGVITVKECLKVEGGKSESSSSLARRGGD